VLNSLEGLLAEGLVMYYAYSIKDIITFLGDPAAPDSDGYYLLAKFSALMLAS